MEMEQFESPLAMNARKRRQQETALNALKRAFHRCQEAGVVIVGKGQTLFAFDEDRLFESGWTPKADVQTAAEAVGRLQIETHDVFLVCDGQQPND
jgi:hypothetical protein